MVQKTESRKLIYSEDNKEWYQMTLPNGRVIVFIIDKTKENEEN